MILLPKKHISSGQQNRSGTMWNLANSLSYYDWLEVKTRCGNSDKSDGTSNALPIHCIVPTICSIIHSNVLKATNFYVYNYKNEFCRKQY